MVRRAKPSGRRLTAADASIVKGMADRGDRHHDIAAWFGVNQGRIAEVLAGDKYPNAPIVPRDQLPAPGPYMSGQASYKAIKSLEDARSALANAAKSIDQVLKNVKKTT